MIYWQCVANYVVHGWYSDTLCCFKKPEFIWDPAFNRIFTVYHYRKQRTLLICRRVTTTMVRCCSSSLVVYTWRRRQRRPTTNLLCFCGATPLTMVHGLHCVAGCARGWAAGWRQMHWSYSAQSLITHSPHLAVCLAAYICALDTWRRGWAGPQTLGTTD